MPGGSWAERAIYPAPQGTTDADYSQVAHWIVRVCRNFNIKEGKVFNLGVFTVKVKLQSSADGGVTWNDIAGCAVTVVPGGIGHFHGTVVGTDRFRVVAYGIYGSTTFSLEFQNVGYGMNDLPENELPAARTLLETLPHMGT